ncbi:hypothetical protein R1flu_009139 [Riccia fluitans]|uniref:Lipid desaturase domain-containing protein n=1 Tax=Riccia fluitans TaxID=41844 RepID=A0ABD1Z5D5_9MARC
MRDAITRILAAEGLAGLYEGTLPSVVKAAPAAAISFVVYEAVLLEPPSQQVQESEETSAGPGLSSLFPSQQLNLERKISSLPSELEIVLNDTKLESTPEHRFWVGVGPAAVLGMVTKAVTAAHSPEDMILIVTSMFAGYLLVDLGPGIYHWGVDNYGNARTPIVGSQIDAFQGHHKRPRIITKSNSPTTFTPSIGPWPSP